MAKIATASDAGTLSWRILSSCNPRTMNSCLKKTVVNSFPSSLFDACQPFFSLVLPNMHMAARKPDKLPMLTGCTGIKLVEL